MHQNHPPGGYSAPKPPTLRQVLGTTAGTVLAILAVAGVTWGATHPLEVIGAAERLRLVLEELA